MVEPFIRLKYPFSLRSECFSLFKRPCFKHANRGLPQFISYRVDCTDVSRSRVTLDLNPDWFKSERARRRLAGDPLPTMLAVMHEEATDFPAPVAKEAERARTEARRFGVERRQMREEMTRMREEIRKLGASKWIIRFHDVGAEAGYAGVA